MRCSLACKAKGLDGISKLFNINDDHTVEMFNLLQKIALLGGRVFHAREGVSGICSTEPAPVNKIEYDIRLVQSLKQGIEVGKGNGFNFRNKCSGINHLDFTIQLVSQFIQCSFLIGLI